METEFQLEQNQTYEESNKVKTDNLNSGNAERYAVSMNGDSSVDEIEQKTTEYIAKNENGDYICKICGKVSGKKITNMKYHIETHLEGISFSCSICGKQFRSRNSLKVHKTTNHKNK